MQTGGKGQVTTANATEEWHPQVKTMKSVETSRASTWEPPRWSRQSISLSVAPGLSPKIVGAKRSVTETMLQGHMTHNWHLSEDPQPVRDTTWYNMIHGNGREFVVWAICTCKIWGAPGAIWIKQVDLRMWWWCLWYFGNINLVESQCLGHTRLSNLFARPLAQEHWNDLGELFSRCQTWTNHIPLVIHCHLNSSKWTNPALNQWYTSASAGCCFLGEGMGLATTWTETYFRLGHHFDVRPGDCRMVIFFLVQRLGRKRWSSFTWSWFKRTTQQIGWFEQLLHFVWFPP